MIILKIKIIPLNKKGEDALRIQVKEFQRMNWVNKQILKRSGVKQQIIENPFSSSINISGRLGLLMDVNYFINEINKVMKENGATKKDYKIEVGKDE